MGELWLGSTTREFVLKKENVLFSKRFGPAGDAVSQVGREVQWQVLEKGKRKVSNDFQNPRG